MAAERVGRMKLGSQGLEVSAQGLGCMDMSAFYGAPKPEPDMIALIHHAVNSGITFLDTSDVYGPHTNEILLCKALKGGLRDTVELATKFGNIRVNGKREHRIDIRVPIEVKSNNNVLVDGELKKLVEEGKMKYIGLSEASASTIRRAHAVHPITAVQLEWSLWSRCGRRNSSYLQGTWNWDCCIQPARAGISFIRAITGGEFIGPRCQKGSYQFDANFNLHSKDLLVIMHIKFQPENLEHNKHLYERVKEMATRKGCTPSQLALAWVHHQGNDVCPILGTTKIENLNPNIGALSVKLTPEEMAEIEVIASKDDVQGDRYPSGVTTFKNSDTPPLSSWKPE
ncbi:hypothetical protein SLEP1_g31278 [Rubroshorea leprosula]|uniref:NADP-dependent oxidoreductase domain-containing protein n=1 Tax=Rubroshorea leprosula TaxID=152421 RepID=A0AAV5KB03_9ROSI|nr:hypothetical protein SLEP1_g31278 [Rubroshorea leprosula]